MKLWGGRFEKAMDASVDDFHSSITFDKRLAKYDIAGSIAHATMLGERGIIPAADALLIVDGLKSILADVEAGNIEYDLAAEDIHMNIESILITRIGEAGKRLHTGRSRNDQVALDARMYVKDAIIETKALIKALMTAIYDIAEANIYTVMPGYTHLQKAQPVTLAHHMLAWFNMLARDLERLDGAYERADCMPLGAGALAATTYPLDRERVRELLGFARLCPNSMDAVADRDYMLEYLAAASISLMHLSRMCEEVILWSSGEFGYIELDDGFSTGSSIMPQKKNPDVAELIRGKTGRVYGDLIGLLTAMKGLPLAYNKDMQEDKEALFDARDTWTKCLSTFTGMITTARFKPENMAKAAAQGFTNATDAADYLVKKGMPFREAHEVIGRMVLNCIHENKALNDLTLDEFKAYSPMFESDVYDAISILSCVETRAVAGGPAPVAVKAALAGAHSILAK